jgi:hypothetical protein
MNARRCSGSRLVFPWLLRWELLLEDLMYDEWWLELLAREE